MEKRELIPLLEENYSAFIKYVDSLSNKAFNYNREGKWSAGQHLNHLVLSVQPLTYVFGLDKIVITEKFGSTTKKARSFTEMKISYLKKLKNGGTAPKQYVTDVQTINTKAVLCQDLRALVSELGASIENFSEEELETLCVPHPLLGNISLREMLYNAIYHAEHHQNSIIKMLGTKFDSIN